MAKFKSSTFGRISGRVGDVVAVPLKNGINYFRAYIIPPNPNSIKQQNQRGKFGFVMKQLNCMRKVFAKTLGGQYGINKAVSNAMKACVSGEYPDFKLDYSKLTLSAGNNDKMNRLLEFRRKNSIEISWDDFNLTTMNAADSISLVFLNQTRLQMIYLNSVTNRQSSGFEFDLPENWANQEIHGWLFTYSQKTGTFSDSQYIYLN